ncbi:MAG: hypothetical protein M3Z49_00465 [Bifidobacteriales bacterium]|nr:hypothetical protein [Bifidobacterium sp.]MCT6917668.1 hypothetical protein [Bifidobacteriales bacterium]
MTVNVRKRFSEWAALVGCPEHDLMTYCINESGGDWGVRKWMPHGGLGPMIKTSGSFPDPVRWNIWPGDYYLTSGVSVDETVKRLRDGMTKAGYGDFSDSDQGRMGGDLVKDAKALDIRVRTLARLEKQGHSADEIRRDLGKILGRYRHMSRDEAVQRWYDGED